MNKVKQIREALEMNSSEFSQFLGFPYMTVVNWEKRNTLPKPGDIMKFGKKIPGFNAEFFYKKNAPMFLKEKEHERVTANTDKTSDSMPSRSVNVYGRVAAGVSVPLWDNHEMTIEISHPLLNKLKKELFGFMVTGDSMLPRFRKDDILITKKLNIDDKELPKDRDFVVTVFKNTTGTSEANVKLFSWKGKSKKEFILSSVNPYVQPKFHNMKEVRYMFKVYLVISEISYNEKI